MGERVIPLVKTLEASLAEGKRVRVAAAVKATMSPERITQKLEKDKTGGAFASRTKTVKVLASPSGGVPLSVTRTVTG